jgi:hypothetical protein
MQIKFSFRSSMAGRNTQLEPQVLLDCAGLREKTGG